MILYYLLIDKQTSDKFFFLSYRKQTEIAESQITVYNNQFRNTFRKFHNHFNSYMKHTSNVTSISCLLNVVKGYFEIIFRPVIVFLPNF